MNGLRDHCLFLVTLRMCHIIMSWNSTGHCGFFHFRFINTSVLFWGCIWGYGTIIARSISKAWDFSARTTIIQHMKAIYMYMHSWSYGPFMNRFIWGRSGLQCSFWFFTACRICSTITMVRPLVFRTKIKRWNKAKRPCAFRAKSSRYLNIV